MLLGATPFIAWHIDHGTAWIDLLFVPRELRHRGRGTAMVERVLRGLPAEVREVEVLATQLDDELPIGFWEKLGFEPETNFGEPLSGVYLRKFLRGEPTNLGAR